MVLLLAGFLFFMCFIYFTLSIFLDEVFTFDCNWFSSFIFIHSRYSFLHTRFDRDHTIVPFAIRLNIPLPSKSRQSAYKRSSYNNNTTTTAAQQQQRPIKNQSVIHTHLSIYRLDACGAARIFFSKQFFLLCIFLVALIPHDSFDMLRNINSYRVV